MQDSKDTAWARDFSEHPEEEVAANDQVAGDVALILGAVDGVFLAGGIVKRYPNLLKSSGFRNGFENKGRHRPVMEQVPTLLITHDQPGLLGAAHVASLLNSGKS